MKEFLPYVGLLALLVSIANAAYSRRRDAQGDWKEKFKEIVNELKDVSRRLIVVETQTAIYFKGMSVLSAQDLHSPHTPELDLLLEKFQRDEIQNEKELEHLKELLAEVRDSEDETPERRKLAKATLLLIHVRFEIGGDLVTSFRRTN